MDSVRRLSRWRLPLLALTVASLACQALLPVSPATPSATSLLKPTLEAADSKLGLSRSAPAPLGTALAATHWTVEVLETERGAAAWRALQAANQFNDSAPEGWEYLLVKVRVTRTSAGPEREISGSDFQVTGDQLIRYFRASAVAPGPNLEGALLSGESVEGWSPYLVKQNEASLMLILDEIESEPDEAPRYLALEPGASLTVDPALADVAATALGADAREPARLGDTLVTNDWELTATLVMRGEAAWQMVTEANSFNDPPAEGMEYVAVRIHVRYLGLEENWAHIDHLFFKAIGSRQVEYEAPYLINPEPALDVNLYPGGEYEGWVVVQAVIGEGDLVLIFKPLFAFTEDETRYIALDT
jgi:hypothetical protein